MSRIGFKDGEWVSEMTRIIMMMSVCAPKVVKMWRTRAALQNEHNISEPLVQGPETTPISLLRLVCEAPEGTELVVHTYRQIDIKEGWIFLPIDRPNIFLTFRRCRHCFAWDVHSLRMMTRWDWHRRLESKWMRKMGAPLLRSQSHLNRHLIFRFVYMYYCCIRRR